MNIVALLAFVAGLCMCVLAFPKIGTDQFPLYIIAAFVCYTCAGVFMLVNKK